MSLYFKFHLKISCFLQVSIENIGVGHFIVRTLAYDRGRTAEVAHFDPSLFLQGVQAVIDLPQTDTHGTWINRVGFLCCLHE